MTTKTTDKCEWVLINKYSDGLDHYKTACNGPDHFGGCYTRWHIRFFKFCPYCFREIEVNK